MSKKVDWVKIQDWQKDNEHLLIMVADPATDSISISYGGLNGFVKFPMESLDKGVIFNALRESSFKDAISPLITGISEGTGITPANAGGNELLKALGGGIKSIGITKAAQNRSNLSNFMKKDNGKKTKTRK